MNAVDRRLARRKILVVVSRWVRLLRRFLLQFDAGPRRTPADFSRAAAGILWLVRFYYLFIAYAIIQAGLRFTYAGSLPTDPLWPVGLLGEVIGFGWQGNIAVISVASSTVALLAVIFPSVLIWRLGVFLYLFFAGAIQGSYGAVNHGHHIYLYVSFALLFLPSSSSKGTGRMARRNAMSVIVVFWIVQSLILLPYSLSGFWKVFHSNLQLFEPGGMVRILLSRAMSDTREIPLLLPLAVSQEWLAQLMLLVTVYVQCFAIFALFRPHLHRPIGIILILFHLGIIWLLGFSSFAFPIIPGLFLVFSPMAPAQFSLPGLVRSLPLVDIPFRLWGYLHRSPQRTR